jgi:aminoglycoside phosphotransferase (APT) family kinase protein
MREEQIAAQIFKEYGLSISTSKRAGGWTNAVWFNEDVVLRLSLNKDSNRIHKEIMLSKMLPLEAGYPENILTGVIDGYEWSLSKRISGTNLREAWPNLTWKQRTHANKQIWEIMNKIHTVDIKKVSDLSANRPWYSSLDADEIIQRFQYYVDKEYFTKEQVEILINQLKAFWNTLNNNKVYLNHGDITMENILCNEGNILSFIDFEHSCIAPREIDLNSFINLAFFDEEGNILSDDSNPDEFLLYKLEIKKLIDPILKQVDTSELLCGFAILFHQRFFEFWLDNPIGSIVDIKPYQKIISFTKQNGGYLSEILNF